MMKYGLIGKPLIHSHSPFVHSFFGYEYLLKELEENELDDFFAKKDFVGINVTIPYKQKIIPYLDEINREAREIGAVNVVRVFRDGSDVILKGYNSDVIGFRESITPLLHPHHQKALILGTGGAAKAVKYVLEKKGLETVFVSRYTRPGTVSYKDIDSNAVKEYEVIAF